MNNEFKRDLTMTFYQNNLNNLANPKQLGLGLEEINDAKVDNNMNSNNNDEQSPFTLLNSQKSNKFQSPPPTDAYLNIGQNYSRSFNQIQSYNDKQEKFLLQSQTSHYSDNSANNNINLLSQHHHHYTNQNQNNANQNPLGELWGNNVANNEQQQQNNQIFDESDQSFISQQMRSQMFNKKQYSTPIKQQYNPSYAEAMLQIVTPPVSNQHFKQKNFANSNQNLLNNNPLDYSGGSQPQNQNNYPMINQIGLYQSASPLNQMNQNYHTPIQIANNVKSVRPNSFFNDSNSGYNNKYQLQDSQEQQLQQRSQSSQQSYQQNQNQNNNISQKQQLQIKLEFQQQQIQPQLSENKNMYQTTLNKKKKKKDENSSGDQSNHSTKNCKNENQFNKMDTLTTPALFREKDRDQDAANNAEDSINRSIRGLRVLSLSVKDIVCQKKSSTYKEVAEILIKQLNLTQHLKENSKDEQNVKRRVYDALNVLISADIIKKKGKNVMSDKNSFLMGNSFKKTIQEELKDLKQNSIQKEGIIQYKNQVLKEMTFKYLSLRQLIKRNNYLQEFASINVNNHSNQQTSEPSQAKNQNSRIEQSAQFAQPRKKGRPSNKIAAKQKAIDFEDASAENPEPKSQNHNWNQQVNDNEVIKFPFILFSIPNNEKVKLLMNNERSIMKINSKKKLNIFGDIDVLLKMKLYEKVSQQDLNDWVPSDVQKYTHTRKKIHF